MKYFRLKRNTPNADAGDVFFTHGGMDHYQKIDVNTAKDYNDVTFPIEDVELNPYWFEEVILIAVAPRNAWRLQEIDDLADENTDIADPVFVPAREEQADSPDPEAYERKRRAIAEMEARDVENRQLCTEQNPCDDCASSEASVPEVSSEVPRLNPLAALILASALAKRAQ